MKRLTLLRHAKSGWDDPVARDFDRPLNAKGQRAAVLIGRYAARERIGFDHVLASPALRVVETIAHFAIGYDARIEPVWERRIYLASAATLIDLVAALPASVDHALMVGHNPGLEDFVLNMVPDAPEDRLRASVEMKFPTASLAELHFDIASWPDIASATAMLTRFIRPRDLDPALGPDCD